ncbi:7681_t:CDS:1 [Funneliformis caledonium]|uniref:7681_t:CDS:1 n=1 Tax=Funneliformis caledonium TaxID=1117310 RepID=A0A9N9EDJ5_9GLOM|nr:7681_t:CDS:1 [Funneliformis caledonium]
MKVKPLNDNCLREIVEHLSDDKITLYSCMYANRTFCKNVVPILWRNPWINSSIRYDDTIFWKVIGKTIIKCLPNDSKEFLFKKGLRLNPSVIGPPLFNYISYCQSLSSTIIRKLTDNILDGYNTNNTSSDYKILIEEEFWKLFLKQSYSIKFFKLPTFKIFEYPGAKNSLKYLSTLECDTFLTSEYFLEIQKYCHFIRRIEIVMNFNNYNEEIESLILTQKNLQELKFIALDEKKVFRFKKEKTITFLSHSLKSIEFENRVCLPSQIFPSFNNLTELHLNLKNFDYISLYCLKDIIIPQLEVLNFKNAVGVNFDIYSKFISNTHGFLRIIKIETKSHPPISNIEIYLQTLSTYCPRIEVVPIWLARRQSLDVFDSFLFSSNELKVIQIELKEPNDLHLNKEPALARPILELLATRSSPELKKIYLKGKWSFSHLDLQGFFEMWKGRRRLLTFNLDNDFYSYYIVRVCEEYYKQGVINGGTINYTSKA